MSYPQYATVTLTRQELYDRLWKTPATKVAKTLGISDVALCKVCRKHNIPKPPMGYWARIQHGQKPEKVPLPPIDDERLASVQFSMCVNPEAKPAVSPKAVAQVEAEKLEANRISVPETLDSPHPLTERTAKSIRSAAPDDRGGLVRPKAQQCLTIAVTPANVERALRIFDALLKALEKRGFPVSVEDTENSRRTFVKVLDEQLSLVVDERVRCREKDLTPAQKQEQQRHTLRLWPKKEYVWIPTGLLTLHIEGGLGSGYRRNWSDCTTLKLENRLNSFIAGLVHVAEETKAARLESERRHREWEEEKRRREEEEKRQQEERDRIRDLRHKLRAWRRSRQIRRYVAAVERAASQLPGGIFPESELASWLAWAKSRADKLDPSTQPNAHTMTPELPPELPKYPRYPFR